MCLTSVKWPERDADGRAVEQSGACTVLHQVQSMLEWGAAWSALQSSRDRVGMVTQEQEDHDIGQPCRVHAWKLQAATAWPQR